jgi:hypothetical protein
MFWRAFLAMVTADAVDRHRRERQYRAWVAAEAARVAESNGRRQPLIAPPPPPSEYDPGRPERPTKAGAIDARRSVGGPADTGFAGIRA